MHGPLRVIFPATVLGLWALFGLGLASGAWTGTQWLMLVLGHLSCTIIFVSFVYVFNYGYGLSLTVIGAAILWLMPSPAAALVGALAIAFGVRMIAFTHARYQAPGFAAKFARQQQASAAMPLPAKLVLWVFVSWLMGFELMALYFVAQRGVADGWVVAGAALMLAGLVVEAIADGQKQAAKAQAPDRFVGGGLYAFARHANYTGEMVFQAGLLVAGLGAAAGWWETLVAVLAPAYVIVLMVFSGLGADREQAQRYGADPAWQAYRARTGCFLPGL